MQIRLLACAAMLALAVAAPGCGDDDDDDQNGGDTSAVTEAATAVITDPDKSCDLLTQKALKVFTGGATGDEAKTKCEEQVSGGQLPDSATVTVIDSGDDRASVGYVTDQVTGAMILVKVDGKWLMDSVTTLSN